MKYPKAKPSRERDSALVTAAEKKAGGRMPKKMMKSKYRMSADGAMKK